MLPMLIPSSSVGVHETARMVPFRSPASTAALYPSSMPDLCTSMLIFSSDPSTARISASLRELLNARDWYSLRPNSLASLIIRDCFDTAGSRNCSTASPLAPFPAMWCMYLGKSPEQNLIGSPMVADAATNWIRGLSLSSRPSIHRTLAP